MAGFDLTTEVWRAHAAPARRL